MRKLLAFARLQTHLTFPEYPRSPRCPPSLVVGILVQCVDRRARGRRNAFGVWSGCSHIMQPRKVEINRATASAAGADGTRRSRRRWRCDNAHGSEHIAGARRRASALAAFLTPSRCRDGMAAGSCLDHSRSQGLREGGRNGHLDKVFGEVGIRRRELRCEMKTRMGRGFSRIWRMIADKKLV